MEKQKMIKQKSVNEMTKLERLSYNLKLWEQGSVYLDKSNEGYVIGFLVDEINTLKKKVNAIEEGDKNE